MFAPTAIQVSLLRDLEISQIFDIFSPCLVTSPYSQYAYGIHLFALGFS